MQVEKWSKDHYHFNCLNSKHIFYYCINSDIICEYCKKQRKYMIVTSDKDYCYACSSKKKNWNLKSILWK